VPLIATGAAKKQHNSAGFTTDKLKNLNLSDEKNTEIINPHLASQKSNRAVIP